MTDIGCVVYTETETGIDAEWAFSENGKIVGGTGIGTRLTEANPARRFEGQYEIIYSDDRGSKSPMLKLTISFESETYKLTWAIDGTVTDIGVGIVNGDRLCVGYRPWEVA